jgi:hypothetical protein
MRSSKLLAASATLGTLLLVWAPAARGQTPDWRSDVAGYFSQRDMPGAAGYLEEVMGRLEADEKPEAAALLAYLDDRLGNKTRARTELTLFFETYGGPNVSFPYLGLVAEAEVLGYINSWRAKFPDVLVVSMVRDKKNPGPMPPRELMLGLEVTNDCLYRFSDASGIMGGGMLHKGFNILTIPTSGYFDHSGSHAYSLDLKSGDIRVRKEITVSVSMTPEPAPTPQQEITETKGMAYDLSMYVGDQLITGSTRTERQTDPLKLNIKPVNLVANPLFKPPGQHDNFDPAQNGISILQAVGVISGLVKDLLTKKPVKAESAYEKLSVVGLSYFRTGPSNTEVEVKATLTLETKAVPPPER